MHGFIDDTPELFRLVQPAPRAEAAWLSRRAHRQRSKSLVGQIGESKLKGEIVISDLKDHKGKVVDTSKPSDTFTGYALNEFIQDVAIRYVEDDDDNMTKMDLCLPPACSSVLVKMLIWSGAICWRDCGSELVDILLPVREFEAPLELLIPTSF